MSIVPTIVVVDGVIDSDLPCFVVEIQQHGRDEYIIEQYSYLEGVSQQEIKHSDAFDLTELGQALAQYTVEDFVNDEAEPDSSEE